MSLVFALHGNSAMYLQMQSTCPFASMLKAYIQLQLIPPAEYLCKRPSTKFELCLPVLTPGHSASVVGVILGEFLNIDKLTNLRISECTV